MKITLRQVYEKVERIDDRMRGLENNVNTLKTMVGGLLVGIVGAIVKLVQNGKG